MVLIAESLNGQFIMTDKLVKIGVVGCGNISGIYLKNAPRFGNIEVAAVADLDTARASAKAAEYGVPKVCSVPELLADPEIDIVLNLTIPGAHADIGLAAVEAGKSVYNEKPLTIRREDAARMLEIARANGVLVGGAPDTFLGAGLQTCRQLIDEGLIGTPVAATAFMTGHGHESWHPDPEFYYKVGGGPLFDMGPYYLTALVALVGGVRRVTGSTRITFAERTITSKPKHGQTIKVDVPTHITGVLDFASGAVGTLIMSFDVWKANLPYIEIYGSEGTMSVPDPNTFGGAVRVYRPDWQEWREMPIRRPFADNSRGLGVADMARALREGANGVMHRANGQLAYHVLDIMHAVHEASDSGRHVELTSAPERPAPLPAAAFAE